MRLHVRVCIYIELRLDNERGNDTLSPYTCTHTHRPTTESLGQSGGEKCVVYLGLSSPAIIAPARGESIATPAAAYASARFFSARQLRFN